MTETELQTHITDLARHFGWLYYHTHDSRNSVAGFPDLVMLRADRAIFAELKSDDGKLTPEQNVWIEALARADQEVYVWQPKHIEEAAKILNEWKPLSYRQRLEYDSAVVCCK